MKKNWLFVFLPTFLLSCSSAEMKEEKKVPAPDFCDCVNKDYHQPGDKEACEKIEKELEEKLEKATKEERGEILIRIRDCKVKGQYDND